MQRTVALVSHSVPITLTLRSQGQARILAPQGTTDEELTQMARQRILAEEKFDLIPIHPCRPEGKSQRRV